MNIIKALYIFGPKSYFKNRFRICVSLCSLGSSTLLDNTKFKFVICRTLFHYFKTLCEPELKN